MESRSARQVLIHHKSSVWLGKGESQAQWELIRAGSKPPVARCIELAPALLTRI